MSTLPDHLRLFFRDESMQSVLLPLTRDEESGLCTVGDREVAVDLPNGETINVYAEVAEHEGVADISLSIIQDGRDFDVRCLGGLIVNYTSAGGMDVLCQIGTGPWD
ncbi:hypothetical protein [Pseudofulvimonas gallinarii]|jgi:hypothetical protein|uniref:Uncharacterized protein n=1 Tax=Pseudofulvimonas gallinarii TaxID=634155 RepID=A0A4R3L9A2_9GAMM|nr:hypothetical protein [Pseudofulvimonas gallinarii]TCS94076.1 hypothetical protein EDC25_12451 [Pseudofulvimonas gallinarii]THD12987.1 hypothetical protein B1808_10070 [Pseudofulvimonas gallinarii]